MIARERERRLLQAGVLAGSLVPLGAGVLGIIAGGSMVGSEVAAGVDLDSHVRYLSGLLFAIGLAYVASVPRIEHHAGRFRLLTAIVFVGGLARLYGLAVTGIPGTGMLFGLVMELVVTPALCLWQGRVARRY